MNKFFVLIALSLPFLTLYAQTPFDAFSPETSRIILDGDSIADLRNEQLLLVDIASHRPIVAAPFTDEIKNWLSVDPLVDKNITTSPYLYCNGNPVMFIDPDGRDWYYSFDENGERVYTYNENVFSQEDLAAMDIDGIYAGITTSYNNTYYGLFGFEYTDNNDKIFAKRMDQFLIEEAKCNQLGENYHMTFVMPGMKNGQTMEFNYAGGRVIYSQVEYNRLHLEDWGDIWSNNRDFMTNKGFSGYVIKFNNDKKYDPINIIYKDKTLQQNIYDLFNKTLYRRKGF